MSLDKKNVYFYVRTDSAITPDTDSNWMLLFINTDSDQQTGWYGYDLMIDNKQASSKGKTAVMCYKNGIWTKVTEVPYAVTGNQMELSVPVSLLNASKKIGQFDFKWADNPKALDTIIDLCTDGDTAPNRRFNYRYKWNFK